jgi:hypothetical protein
MNIYFMMLVGAFAGLTSWAIVTLVVRTIPEVGESAFLDAVNMGLLGMCICGMAVGFSDYWAEGRILGITVATGILLGLLVGLVAGLAANTIHTQLGPIAPFAARLIPWGLAGGLIGFGAGSRWFGVNMYRPLVSTVGGMCGATIGGALFTASGSVLPQAADFIQASAFVITGVGISAGVVVAPALLSDGLLRFWSSADTNTVARCSGSEWLLHEGDRLLIGSLPMNQTRSIYGKEIDIYLPDPNVARRHAYVFGLSGRYFIEAATENLNQQGWPAKTLQVGEHAVQGQHELLHNDVITLGTTQILFETRERRTGS